MLNEVKQYWRKVDNYSFSKYLFKLENWLVLEGETIN